MSIIPFFPSLMPPMAKKPSFKYNSTASADEAEITQIEREHQTWLESFKSVASDVQPLGKVLVPAPETDEEDGNDDSDDSDSHDDEDDDNVHDRTIHETDRSALEANSPVEDSNIIDDSSGMN